MNSDQVFLLFLQVSAYSAACVTVSAFSRGLVDATKAEEVLNALRTLTEENRQVSKHIDIKNKKKPRPYR